MVDELSETGTLILTDCAQSAGKLDLPDADMLVVSAHKFGGPIGIGALLVRDWNLLEPMGGHERGYRQGTENLPGALGNRYKRERRHHAPGGVLPAHQGFHADNFATGCVYLGLVAEFKLVIAHRIA